MTAVRNKAKEPKKSGGIPKRLKIPLILLLIIICLVAVCAVYLGDYYHASAEAMEALRNPPKTVTVIEKQNDRIIFLPENPAVGFIFYPGGKVQYEAYAPLMEACAARGVLCVLLHMPGNLAVLDRNAADGVIDDYPEITEWCIGGHSLGGAMAASYAAKHAEDIRGLILLAAYSTADLRDSGLQVLAVYGTEDGVMNREKYTEGLALLPDDFTEIVIDGGCHAYFGSYGPQKSDGTPTISNQEQIEQTADAILVLTV